MNEFFEIVKLMLPVAFKKWLEKSKHAREQESEIKRQQSNIKFSRIMKIHEKEIEILPELWIKLQDALGQVHSLTSVLQNYPDLKRLSENELEKFLSESELSDQDKQKITFSNDRNGTYKKMIFWYRLHTANSSLNEFHNFLINNEIFLNKDLRNRLKEIDNLMSSVLGIREAGEKAEDYQLINKAYEDLQNKVRPIVSEIEELIQDRLEFPKANTPEI